MQLVSRGAMKLALALLMAAMAAGGAQAESQMVDGAQLVLTNTLSSDTVIGVDPALSGHVRVTLDGESGDTGCLSLIGGASAVVSTSGCSAESGALRIDVPPGAPITLTNTSDGAVHLPDTDAPVTLTLTGSGDVNGGRVGYLTLAVHGSSDVKLGVVRGGAALEMTGSGDVRLTSVLGALVIKRQGSGDLAVGHIEAPTVDIQSSGSGDTLLGGGSIATLVSHMQGAGDLAVAADVHDGDVSAYGGGDVKLGRITGTVRRSHGGGSDIYVGGPHALDSVIGKVAMAVGNGESFDTTSSQAPSILGHLLTACVVGLMAYIVWRIIKRGGGVAAMRSSFGRSGRPEPAAPTHPGVVAVCDMMARLDQRLGRVEGYVTSREFDLQQKFRQL